ncbi:aldo/keto reductase [Sphingobium sp. EP60837]|uniref:aldo/keto reductase n=1 Tax=Sphingobium sp. EP60837 TaxID=1855519 RepID=UPI0007DD9677|nr:aldo/keto reductase [Sphingobium sp. EP60837]ANI80130.1 putative oxidoreductase YrpG [Sphingobium sp. EP60837]
MEYSHLGRSGLLVSPICLGTLNFGYKTDEPTAHQMMEYAHDNGINFFDTSNVYGTKDFKGEANSEIIIGNWFAQGGGRRERTVLASKVFNPRGTWPNESRLSAFHIRQACEDSLRRLKTDRIDLYQMHHVDRDTPWEEIWEAMTVLRTQGKILYVGSSNFGGWHIAAAQEAARARHFMGLVSEQSIYNLATRQIEMEVIPAAQHYGVGVLAWSPLHRGMLAGVLQQTSNSGRYTDEQLTHFRSQLERYEALCAEIGILPSQVALAWVASRPGVTGCVIGPSTISQVDDALRSLEVRLSDEILVKLDEIFPGYKTSPENYAW